MRTLGILIRRILIVATIGCVSSAFLPESIAADDVKTLSVSGAEMDKALEGKKTYSFVVISKDEIVDMDGRHFSPKAVKAYLKKAKPDKKAAYVFLLTNDGLMDTASSVIEDFSKYGVTVFAVRRLEKGGTTVTAPAKGGESPGGKNLMMVGTPNAKSHTASDPAPDMGSRPAHLRPGKLPPRVRYRFAPDEEVIEASERTTRLLLRSGDGETLKGFESVMLVQPGAWKRISDVSELKGTKPMIGMVELGRKVARLEGRLIQDAAQFDAVVKRVRELIEADGGGSVRALSSKEMDRWWTFITLDIEEPVFVVETKGGKYLFVVCWGGDHVFCIDELNALPKS